MSAELVSVVIPVYDIEAYLAETVASVLAQTHRHLDVVLIDDGSTDGSGGIARDLAARFPDRVRALFLGHRGASAARNAGIDAARGEWIAFLDGDDLWMPAKLERQLEAAVAAPGLDFLATEAVELGTGRPLRTAFPASGDLRLDLLLAGCFVVLSSTLLRRRLLAAERFDESLPGAQDLDLFLRLAPRARFHLQREPLVAYRVRPGSISDPLGARHLQLASHYRVARREVATLRRADPALWRTHRRALRTTLRRVAHEAAWAALVSPSTTSGERVRLALLALARDPARAKNWRFLLQALLPAAANRHLAGI